MTSRAFALLIALVVLAGTAPALFQLMQTGGVLYYTNGADEVSYLQVDFARALAAITRPGEYLVLALHRAGLSGGWQNFLFDLMTPVALGLGLAALFRRLGGAPDEARLAAAALLAVPVLASGANPVLSALSFRNQTHATFGWLNMVVQHTCALLRTPEPQCSYMALVAALLVALRVRSAWPVLVLTPFLYPFVGIPAAFMGLAWELRARWGERPGATAGPLVLAWLACGVAAGAMIQIAVSPATRLFMTASHAPVLSLASVVALALWAWLRAGMVKEHRFVALALALAPLAAGNLHVLTGALAQPANYEECTGILAVAGVLALGAASAPRVGRAAVALGCCMWLWAGFASFRANATTAGLVPFDARLATALQRDAHHVAVGDMQLAAMLDLAYPMQPMTTLAYDQGNVNVAARYVDGYRCARRRIMRDFPRDMGFQRAVLMLDHHYLYGGQDLNTLHLGRKQTYTTLQDVYQGCDPRFDQPLVYFPVGAR